MIEIAAVILTLGAIFYHSFHFSITVLGLIAFSGVLFLSFIFRTKQGIIFSFLVGTAFLFGGFAIQNAQSTDSPEIYGNRSFDAVIVSVDRRLYRTLLVVKEDEWRYQIPLQGVHELLPGDKLMINGSVMRPQQFVTASGRLFDYPNYLESKGIIAVVNRATIVLTEKGSWSLIRFATQLRFSIADIFSQYIRYPFDGVVAGMVVGYQGGLPQSVQDLFRNTGVLHVLVLSGYNITLLAGFLMVILQTVPFRARTILTIFCILLLVLISGSGIASVRAGIMGSIALFAGLVRRTYQPLRALTLAYLLFFFLSPTTIFFDPGFHLSFLATIFMVLLLPKISSLVQFIPKTHGINFQELLLLAIAIPLFMLPYTMYFSGLVSVVSPIANIILSIITPLSMLLGVLILFSALLTPLAYILGTTISLIGQYTLKVLELLNTIPNINTPPLPWWSVLLFYVVLFYIFFRKSITQYVLQLQSSLLPPSSSSAEGSQ